MGLGPRLRLSQTEARAIGPPKPCHGQGLAGLLRAGLGQLWALSPSPHITIHLDLAGAKILASASQVTPLVELIEMVQYLELCGVLDVQIFQHGGGHCHSTALSQLYNSDSKSYSQKEGFLGLWYFQWR